MGVQAAFILTILPLILYPGDPVAALDLDNGHTASHCLEDVDDILGSQTTWWLTAAGGEAVVACPGGTDGNITRRCLEDAQSPSGGAWDKPDVTQCENQNLDLLLTDAMTYVEKRTQEASQYIEILDSLNALTHQALADSILYPSDIAKTTDLLGKISTKVGALTNINALVQNFTSSYAQMTDTLTSRRTFRVWQNFQHPDAAIVATATSLLLAMEKMAQNLLGAKLSVPSWKQTWSEVKVVEDSVDFLVSVIPEMYNTSEEIRFEGSNGSSTIVFPPEVADIAHANLPQSRVTYGYYKAQFSTLWELMAVEAIPDPNNTNTSLELNSPILSAKVLGVDEDNYRNLSVPIRITLKHLRQVKGYRGSCYFLNMSATSAATRWSKDGCYPVEWNDTHTTCHCHHLTNFALIMDIFEMDISESHTMALSFISYIGGTLSIIGCLLSIVTYEFFRLGSERIRVHQMLAISIIFSQLCFFIGFDRTENLYVCRGFAILLHFFLMSMFCWMLVEGIHLYVSLVKVFRRRSNFKKYCIIGWGVPVVIVAVSASVFFWEYGSQEACWLSNQVLLIAFVPFVAITIAINFGVLVLVMRVMMKSMNNCCKNRNEEIPAARSGLKAIVTLTPLLGLTWVFGFLSVGSDGTLVFTYLFTIFNSLQGVFFFVLHCVLNNDVRRSYERRYRRQSTSGSSNAKSPGIAKDSSSCAPLPPTAQLPQAKGAPTGDHGGGADIDQTTRKRNSAFSLDSAETNVTGVDELEWQGYVTLGELESFPAKLQKDSDNWKCKYLFDNFKVYVGGALSNSTRSTGSTASTGCDDTVKECDVREALDAFDKALSKHGTPQKDILYITHM